MATPFDNLRSRFPEASEDEVRTVLDEHDGHGARAARALRKLYAEAKPEATQPATATSTDRTEIHQAIERRRKQVWDEADKALEVEPGTCPSCWRPSCLGAVNCNKNECVKKANEILQRLRGRSGGKSWKIVAHHGTLTEVRPGAEVYVTHQGEFIPGTLLDSEQASANNVRVQLSSNGEAVGTCPDQVVPRAGYLERISQASPRHGCSEGSAVHVWRCQLWTEGLFSLVFWAVGYLESEHQQHPTATLLIDMADPRLRYRGPEGCPNFWTALFKQPVSADPACRDDTLDEESAPLCAVLEAAQAAGSLSVSSKFGAPFFEKLGEHHGSEPVTGKLTEKCPHHHP